MEPNAHYVLVSTREHGNNPGPVEFRSYRIVDGEVTEEEVMIVDVLPDNPPQHADERHEHDEHPGDPDGR
jgi:hypothetical protein